MLGAWLAAVLSHPDLAGAAAIAGKTAVVYLFLIVGLHLLGKRELGQMTIYDLVLIIVLANSVQNAMVGSDTTLVGGLVAALTLLALDRAFTIVIVRFPALAQRLIGEPRVIVTDGRLLPVPMRQEGVTTEMVMAALREHGLGSLEDARMCVLEVDGTISVVPKDSPVHRTRRHFRALHLG
jgi:uncharacterized membrane protein YcaP (DUF421 family)